jgi:hypothetical protein
MGAVSVLRKRRGVGTELRAMGRRDWRRSGAKVRVAIVAISRYEVGCVGAQLVRCQLELEKIWRGLEMG